MKHDLARAGMAAGVVPRAGETGAEAGGIEEVAAASRYHAFFVKQLTELRSDKNGRNSRKCAHRKIKDLTHEFLRSRLLGT